MNCLPSYLEFKLYREMQMSRIISFGTGEEDDLFEEYIGYSDEELLSIAKNMPWRKKNESCGC